MESLYDPLLGDASGALASGGDSLHSVGTGWLDWRVTTWKSRRRRSLESREGQRS